MKMRATAVLLLFTLSAFGLLGCASPVKRVTLPPEDSPLLFPLGNYVHAVTLEIPENPDAKRRHFEFRGAVKIAPEAIRIVVLSPIGTTLFKLSEDRRTGAVTVENYVSELKPYTAKLTEYYASLRVLLTTLRHPAGAGFTFDARGRPLTLEKKISGRPTKFFFDAYDAHQIPTRLRIESRAFNVRVEVLGYEL
jgi:hypothetical protein